MNSGWLEEFILQGKEKMTIRAYRKMDVKSGLKVDGIWDWGVLGIGEKGRNDGRIVKKLMGQGFERCERWK